MKLSSIKIDSRRLEAGAWVDGIPEMDDLRLKVRGAQNKDAQRLRSKLVAALPAAKKIGGTINADALSAVSAQVLAETVLLDWGNVVDDDGAPIPFSATKALEILSDPDLVSFRDAVYWAAGTLAATEAEEAKSDAGNSVKLSPGASGGAAIATS